jgi:hypothetical protein
MSTYCKYYKQQKQVSYDSGQTWSNVVPAEYQMGSLYEMDSMDCTHGSAIIRWILVPGDYLCEGKDKYEKEIEQYSTDNGVTWMNVYPTTYRKGKLIESNSSICDNKWEGHYTDDSSDTGPCPKNYKWVEGVGCVPIDPVKIIRCSSSPSTKLTQSDVMYNPYVLFEGIIGECVTSIGDRAFQDCTGITSIVIPSGVTSIGNWTFRRCSGLTSIGIPTGVTSIGVGAFERCIGLTSINIPSGVTNIGSDAFSGCTGFTSITVRATTPPTLGDRAFNDTNNCPIYVPCESVNTYRYTPAWKTYETRIQGIPPCETPPPALLKLYASYSGGTTYGILCDSSTTLTQSEVKARAHSESYSAMTDAIVGNCVTSLGDYAFSGCTSLTGITIPSGLTSIGTQAFYRCTGLTSIDIPDSVATIGSSAFSMCNNITTIDIPDGVRTIGERTFSGCSSLSSCTIGSGVTSIGDFAFWHCGLKNIDIPDSVTSIGTYAFNSCGSVTSVTIGSGVTGIGERGFDSCSNLTSITVKATTPPTLAYYVFDNTNNCPIYVPCESVNTYKSAWSKYSSRIYALDCPHKFDATYTGGTSYYKYCDGSTTLTSGDTSPSKSYPHSGMTTVTVGNCVTNIGDGAFYYCIKLSSVTLSDSVTSIGLRAFRDCRSLESIDIPSGVTSISGSAFYYCTSLTSITIPDSVTNFGNMVFYGAGLTSCTIGSGVTTIGFNTFYNCTGLTRVNSNVDGLCNIPDSVRSIGDEAFYHCASLTSIDIPSGVTSIGYSAFYQCTSLTSITVNATTPPTISYDTFNASNNCPIYVPAGSVDTYKAASNWSNYASRIQAIP